MEFTHYHLRDFTDQDIPALCAIFNAIWPDEPVSVEQMEHEERAYPTRAHNDTANPPILALNERLGYGRLPGWLAWEKRL